MLCLSRKQDEGITLIHEQTGERIHVVINGVQGPKTKIGIDAAQHWTILRDELLEDQDAEAK